MSKKLSFVIVYGPPMTGKTLNAQALCEHFNCVDFIEENFLHREDLSRLSGRFLVLTTDVKVRDPRGRGRKILEGRRVSVEQAKRMLGDGWKTKPDAEPTLKHWSKMTHEERVVALVRDGDHILHMCCGGTIQEHIVCGLRAGKVGTLIVAKPSNDTTKLEKLERPVMAEDIVAKHVRWINRLPVDDNTPLFVGMSNRLAGKAVYP
jgi:hypothetical protein